MTAALPLPVISAHVDACIAAIFSAVMRWYSAALQVPFAIMTERWKIVSQEAVPSRAMLSGSASDVWRVRLAMRWKMPTPTDLRKCGERFANGALTATARRTG